MSETSHNPLSPHALDSYESELRASLPGLYPDEGERMIVEEVLIPQLRAEIEKIIGSLSLHGADTTAILVPTDVDNLCSTIDSLLAHNPLLDTDGLLKPALAIIADIRAKVRAELVESFYDRCRAELAKYGITDQASLLSKSLKWFTKETFGTLGDGRNLISKVIGESPVRIFTSHFEKFGAMMFPESDYTKMDAAYFANEENIRHDIELFSKAAKCSIEALSIYKLPLKVTCKNGETMHKNTYLNRAAIALGLAKTNNEAQLKRTDALNLLKKKIGTIIKVYPTMDAAYFSNPKNIRHDLSAYSKTAQCTIAELNTENIKSNTKCNNGESVNGMTYVQRAGVALGLAIDRLEGRSKGAEILVILKKSIGITVDEYPAMDAAYFINPVNIQHDLSAFAQAAGCSIDELNTNKIASHAKCMNGETIHGQTYINRAAFAFKIAKTVRDAHPKTLEVFSKLKELIGVTIEVHAAMDAAYFSSPENIEHDLSAFAKAAGCSINELNTNKLNIKSKCKNGEVIHGYTYLSRAAVAFGIASGSVEAQSKQRETIELLKNKVGVVVAEVEVCISMDAAYFANPQNIRHDLLAFSESARCTLIKLHANKISRKNATCSNGEKICGKTYLIRAVVALGLAKTSRTAEPQIAEMFSKLKKTIEVTVEVYPTMDATYFANPRNIRHDLLSFARQAKCSIGALNGQKMSSNSATCSNFETINGRTYLNRAGVALELAKGSVEASSRGAATLILLKEMGEFEVIENYSKPIEALIKAMPTHADENEDTRAILETVLIPEFISKFVEALNTVILTSVEYPQGTLTADTLWAAIEEHLRQYAELLDLDGLMAPYISDMESHKDQLLALIAA